MFIHAVHSESIRTQMRIKTCQLEMMLDRGYDIADEADVFEMNEREFIRKYSPDAPFQRSHMNRVYAHPDATLDRLIVYYATKNPKDKKQTSKPTIDPLFHLLYTENFHHAVIVVDAPFNSKTVAILDSITSLCYQIFHDSELMINPTKHITVPQHIRMTEEEIEEYKRRTGTSNKKGLLISKHKDPICKWYNFPTDALIKITRSTIAPMTETVIQYRWVC